MKRKHTMKEWWELTEQRMQSWRGLYKDLFSEGDLVFDIGANRGVRTLTFRSLGAKVIAVEPLFVADPATVAEFPWMFKDDPSVIPVPMAASARVGMARIHVQKNIPYISPMSVDWMQKSVHSNFYKRVNTHVVQVPTTTLDALIKEYGEPAFIKIDVEGYESAVMKGLHTPVRAFSIEFHEDWLRNSAFCMKHMCSLGAYEFNYALNNTGTFVSNSWAASDIVMSHLRKNLEERGPKSWGDIYGRRKDVSR